MEGGIQLEGNNSVEKGEGNNRVETDVTGGKSNAGNHFGRMESWL